MKLSSLHQLLIMEVKDLYSAETQLVEALPKMVKAIHSPKVKKAFEQHLEQTKEQVTRMKEAGTHLGVDVTTHTCRAMEGLIQEAEEMMKNDGDPMIQDLAILSVAQRIENYEVAGYSMAHSFASMLKEMPVKRLLKKTLTEERNTIKKVNEMTAKFEGNRALKKRD